MAKKTTSRANFSDVGFIGVGLMGLPMAQNLLAKNPKMRLHVVNGHAEANLRKLTPASRVIRHDTPAKLAEHVSVCFTNLPVPDDVREVTLDGPDALIKGLRRGSIVIDCSTSSASLAQRIDKELQTIGCAGVDCPVSGAPVRAAAGTLSLMVGARPQVYRRIEPLLRCLGTPTHVGPPGAGQVTKSVNQISIGLMIAGISEGLLLARKAGLNLEKVLQAVGAGLGGSELMRIKGPNMIRNRFEPGFFMRYHLKDLNLTMDLARELGLTLPFTDMVRNLLGLGVEMGYGEKDHSAAMAVLEQIEKAQQEYERKKAKGRGAKKAGRKKAGRTRSASTARKSAQGARKTGRRGRRVNIL